MDSNESNIFQFMALRAAEKLDKSLSRSKYVRDDDFFYEAGRLSEWYAASVGSPRVVTRNNGVEEVDLFSARSASPVGREVYKLLFDASAAPVKPKILPKPGVEVSQKDKIIDAVERLLVSGLNYGISPNTRKTTPIINTIALNKALADLDAMALGKASARPSYVKKNILHLPPDELRDLPAPLINQLAAAGNLLKTFANASAGFQKKLDRDDLYAKLANGLGLENIDLALTGLVFDMSGRYAADFALSKRILFDCLYGLYIVGKREKLSLEPVINALGICHFLEAVAINQFLDTCEKYHAVPDGSGHLLNMLVAAYPGLASWDFADKHSAKDFEASHVPMLFTRGDVAFLLNSEPIIHPVFARLNNSFMPFNSLTPIGLGDLKVVKQKFLGYRKGEIAHIETVLAGETKRRVHRSLDKSENSFSISSSTDNETSKDSQSTTRFELKNETEETIKNDIGVNANANFSYKGNPVVEASVGAGMTYSNSRSSSDKAAQNFVNEVVSKATSKIQSRMAEQRSQVRITEVEETNTHDFTNTAAKDHISGIYRWIDKVYEGQVHNFGKRMMFEFMLPEPASFYVESQLYAHVAELDIPRYPTSDKDGSDTSTPTFPADIKKPADINEAKYRSLSGIYDLSAFPYPPEKIENRPIKNIDGSVIFSKTTNYDDSDAGLTEGYTGIVDNIPAGYFLQQFSISGSAEFAMRDETDDKWENTLDVSINEVKLFHRKDETLMEWQNAGETDLNRRSSVNRLVDPPEMVLYSPPSGMVINDRCRIDIFTRTCKKHALSFSVTMERGSNVLSDWQQAVFDEVSRKLNQGTASAGSQDMQSRLIAYKKALDEIKAKAINEIIQGRSSAWNEAKVQKELKRQCITMIAKEFDAEKTDDELLKTTAVGSRAVDVDYKVFQLTPGIFNAQTNKVVSEAIGKFSDVADNPAPAFSAINIEQARKRGRYIQFLEQAFEWNHLSYIFYPYFWAAMPKWIELMHREDLADPMFTDFLQAGSAKTLLAVKPGYENAVLHFLATREPWEGGPSPVIGDALFIPLYDEVRNQQDSMAESVPSGEPWVFTLPTSLVYLESKDYPLQMEYPQPPSN